MTINLDTARAALHDEREKLVHQLGEIGATETGDLRPDLDLGESFADAGAVTAERSELLHCGSGNRVGALLALEAFWLESQSPPSEAAGEAIDADRSVPRP